MKRPWQVWLVFILCVVAAAAGMLWLTRQALRADELRRTAEAETELEQRVSLALWRMDTELAPLVAEEVIRPPSAYRPAFVAPHIYSQQRQVEHLPNGPPQQQAAQQVATPEPAQESPIEQQAATQAPASQQQEVPQTDAPNAAAPSQNAPIPPSGLFLAPPSYVVLHFEARPDGTWVSPQVPPDALTNRASDFGVQPKVVADRKMKLADLAGAVVFPQLLAQLPDTPLPSVAPATRDQVAIAPSMAPSDTWNTDEDLFGEFDEDEQFFEGNNANLSAKSQPGAVEPFAYKGKGIIGKSLKQSKMADFEQRGERYQSAAKQSLMNIRQRQYAANAPANLDLTGESSAEAAAEEQVGISRPVWIGDPPIGDRLILARQVGSNGATVVQGCWLDWPQLKRRLLAETNELLPDADLMRADVDADGDPSRMLAGLPVRLVVNEKPAIGAVNPTLGWALWMGWAAVALAVLAAAALLHGVMTLSERRAAFVSSVTHELRTPLTTFRMYAEMLARGMVPSAARRQEYFETLQREGERLTLLVENVLAYARLERGRRPQRQDRVTVKGLLDRVGPRLTARAAQAGMQCDLRLEVHSAEQEFVTDQSVVEQILFNLVDNAAKYARGAEDRRIHVEANHNGEWVKLVVRDHGPGIEQRPWGRGPRAFGKSAEQSAETAPGVGLGLALCRRLARQLGGRLEIGGANGSGAEVRLLLPRASK